MRIRLGTAGWTVPRQNSGSFPEEGSSLERYSAKLTAAEINSSFHRAHRISTWERWRDSVPSDFRFSVKLPRTITHDAKLRQCLGLIEEFLAQAHVLGEKLAVLLVQLPPKLAFDTELARSFLGELGPRSDAMIAIEPRNRSWFTSEADALLDEFEVARVAADPSICDSAALPGGWQGLAYWRLHGSPVIYRSSYEGRIGELAEKISRNAAEARETWCIFDNTASSAAMSDVLALESALSGKAPPDGC